MLEGQKGRLWNQWGQLLVLFVSFALLIMVVSCTTTGPPKRASAKPEQPAIKEIKVGSFGEGSLTIVEIVGDHPMAYTAFKLTDPPRVVIDIDALPPKTLEKGPVNDKNVRSIDIERVEGKGKTRIIVGIANNVEYKISAQKETVLLALSPKREKVKKNSMAAKAQTAAREASEEPSHAAQTPQKPRIFFKPKATDLNQILGVDFTMLDNGKSRLIITTDKKVPFHLERKGLNVLALIIDNATIPKLLQRHLDSSHFEGAVDLVRASVMPGKKIVTLNITLREMVPFHVDQYEKRIIIEFGPTTIKPPKTTITPLSVAAASTSDSQALGGPKAKSMSAAADGPVYKPRRRKRYTGIPMTMDFVNADVTNILRLIGEVSNLNIVWGPKVKGKVSMRLRNVPWDQALDLVLKNNNLAMRREGNVIWITTREEMAKIEAAEKKKQEELEKRKRELLKRQQELKKLEPLVTQYITVNYVDVNNVKKVIEETVKSPRGKITIDQNTKTIIITDTASRIREAKKLARRLDKPTKQVMIEARIVEASTTFARDLGIQWNYELQHRNKEGVPWGSSYSTPGFPSGGALYGPTFATNTLNVAPNVGIVFSRLSGNGLTGQFLDAKIAVSESEGKVKTLSSPKIVTRDTEKASIQQGTKIVLPSGTDSNGNKTYKLVDASLKLEVTPHITPNNKVIMNVKISDDFPDYANARGENVPINTKSAETTMMVASGDTVVIGGVYIENKGVTETGQPWLKDIPIIGWLFKNKEWNDTRRELLIFLTPRVLPLE